MLSVVGQRYVLGEPAGTFYQVARLAKQRGRAMHRPDVAADAAQVGDVSVFAASLRGAVHHATRTMRQDSFALGVCRTADGMPWVVGAVSDGVSSAARADELANIAARNAVLAACRHLERADAPDQVPWQEVSIEVERITSGYCTACNSAEDLGLATIGEFLGQWACTLELVVVQAQAGPDSGRECFLVPLCGDGGCYVIDGQGEWLCLKRGKAPLPSGLVSNAISNPLPLPLNPPAVVRTNLRAGDSVLLVTDGLGDVLDDPTAGEDARAVAFGRALGTRLAGCESLVEYLRLLDTCVHQAGDDRTGILVKVPPACGPTPDDVHGAGDAPVAAGTFQAAELGEGGVSDAPQADGEVDDCAFGGC